MYAAMQCRFDMGLNQRQTGTLNETDRKGKRKTIVNLLAQMIQKTHLCMICIKQTVFHIPLSFPVPENQEFAGGIVDNDHHDI